MRTLPLFLLLTACDPPPPSGEVVQFDAPATLASEIAVPIQAPATVLNLDPELDLIISDIRFEVGGAPADENVLRWFSEGPFTLSPGQEMTFDVWYRPTEEGPSTATVIVGTDAGEVSASLSLEGLPPTDDDQDGFSEALGDCNDDNAAIYPGAEEICDGLDNDCDESIDGPFDSDRDGYVDEDRCPPEVGELDCNDSDATAFPGNTEECDGSDSDCNGLVDDINEPADLQDGVCAGALKRCTAGGAEEPIYELIEGYERLEYSCDSIDNDCDGVVDDFDRLGDGTDDCTDDDGDGEREIDGDCDDTDKDRFSANCGASTLIVTRNDDGFATIDLNSGRVSLVNIGVRTYHGVGAAPNVMWLAARDAGRLIRYDLGLKAPLYLDPFTRAPVAVEVDDASKNVMVLFGDGGVQLRDPTTGDFVREYDVGGAPTAWTKAPDNTFWVCNREDGDGEGELVHASNSRVLGVAEITTACYGPPALDGNTLIVPGFDDGVIIEMDTRTLRRTRARGTDTAPVRALWVGSDLWMTTSVSRTVEIYDSSDLLPEQTLEFDGQTQGLWYDDQRDLVWIAVFGNNEVVGVDRRTREIRTRLPVPQPVYLFPMPPGG